MSAVAFNWLSDLLQPSAPVVAVVVFVALLALLVADSHVGPTSGAGGSRQRALNFSDTARKRLLTFCLSSLLLGAAIGAIWIIPIWDYWVIQPPFDLLPFRSYELAAAAVIGLLAAVAAVRGRPPADWLIFIASATTGMTLVIVSIAGDDFLATFFGWSIAASLLTAMVAYRPNVFHALRAFFTSPSDQRGRSMFVTPPEERPTAEDATNTECQRAGVNTSLPPRAVTPTEGDRDR